jgi:uncharacterized iron-regulated protein
MAKGDGINSAVGKMTPRRIMIAVVVATLFALPGCAGTTTLPDPEPMAQPAQCVPDGRWVLPGQEGNFATADIVSRFADRSVILLGEFHDDIGHHRWQVQMLSAFLARTPNLAIGLEMLPASAQPVLDQWVAGELSEQEFLDQSHWYEYWKFDADYYWPILHFARMNRVPVYALNAEQSVVAGVRSKGWPALSDMERQGIGDPAPASEAYLEMLAATFSMHGAPHGGESHGDSSPLDQVRDNPAFKRFVSGQQLWDRAMAERIHSVVEKNDVLLVGIMGSGHIMERFGVPHQLADLGMEDAVLMMPWDANFDCAELTPRLADAVFGLQQQSVEEAPKPKLGVHIEPADKGVMVSKVVEGSTAAVAGVREGDIITKMAGVEVSEVQQVIEAVQGTGAGRWLPMVVLRGEDEVELVARFPTADELD